MIAGGARQRAFPAATPAAARLSRLRKAAENLHRGMVGAPATRGHRRAATRVLGIRAHRRAVTLRREVAAVAAAIPHRAVPQGVAAIPRRAIPQAVVAAGGIAAAGGGAQTTGGGGRPGRPQFNYSTGLFSSPPPSRGG